MVIGYNNPQSTNEVGFNGNTSDSYLPGDLFNSWPEVTNLTESCHGFSTFPSDK